MRRASCGSVQPVVRLLPDLHAYSIAVILHAYDAIRSIVYTYETTYEETNSYGRDSNSTAVLRAQQSTYILRTFTTTHRRLSYKSTDELPQRRRRSFR